MAKIIGAFVTREEVKIGNTGKSVWLDLTDTGVLSRWHGLQEWFEKADEKIAALNAILAKQTDGYNDDDIRNASIEFEKIDNEVKEKVDYLFDAPVCEACVGNGSVLREYGEGGAMYAEIVNRFMKLYTNGIEAEHKKSAEKIGKHTNKYIGKTDIKSESEEG